jgi:hypothetical protein
MNSSESPFVKEPKLEDSDFEHNDLRIKNDSSPAVDSGFPSYPYFFESKDNPHLYDINSNPRSPESNDLGAFEFIKQGVLVTKPKNLRIKQ